MVLIILEKVPVSLRGELTRWLLEPKTGVFVGRVSAMVRDRLWQKVCQNANGGACMLIHSTNNEQGFHIEFWGQTSRLVRDFEGLQLVTIPEKARPGKKGREQRRAARETQNESS